MVQHLGVLPALPGDPTLVPSIHMGHLALAPGDLTSPLHSLALYPCVHIAT